MDKDEIIQITDKTYRLTLLFPKKEPLRYKIRDVADDILADFISLEIFSNSNPSNPGKYFKINGDIVFNLKKNLEVIKAYFEIAKWQNWTSYFDILELEAEYDKISKELLDRDLLDREQISDLLEREEFSPNLKTEDLKTEEREKQKEKQEESRVLMPISQIIKERKVVSEPDSADGKDIEENIHQKRTSLDQRKEKILEILKEKEKVQVWEVNEIMPDVSKRTLRRDFVELLKQGLIERIGEKSNTFYRLKTNNQ